MKLFTSCFFVLSSVMSFASYADIKLEIPEFIDIIAVNGLKPVIRDESQGKTLTMPNGVNQLVFQFEPMVEDNDGVRRVYSDVMITKFSIADAQLTFELPKYRRLSQARNDIKTFKWALLDNLKQPIKVESDKLDTNGVQFGRNYIQDVLDYNQKGGVAAIPVAGFTYAKALPEDQQKASIDSENVAQLKLWYLKSSAEERKAFRKWLVDQQ